MLQRHQSFRNFIRVDTDMFFFSILDPPDHPQPPVRKSRLVNGLTNHKSNKLVFADKAFSVPANTSHPVPLNTSHSVSLDTSHSVPADTHGPAEVYSRVSVSLASPSNDSALTKASHGDVEVKPNPVDRQLMDRVSHHDPEIDLTTNHRDSDLVGKPNHMDVEVVRSNGWSDSGSSSSEHLADSKPSEPTRRVGKGKMVSYHMPRAYASRSSHYSGRSSLSSKAKSKPRNGLVKLHSLKLSEINSIADELSLNSSNGSAADSSEPLEDSISPVNDADDSLDKPYLLVRMSRSQSPSSLSESSAHAGQPLSLQPLPDEEHSSAESTSGDSSALSPPVQRTTPVSVGSVDYYTDPSSSMVSSDITVVPAPLLDVPDYQNTSLEAVPHAPPEFAGSSDIDVNIHQYTGYGKGICGSVNSPTSYIDSALYLLSMSTSLLPRSGIDSHYPDLKRHLLQDVVQPLQR